TPYHVVRAHLVDEHAYQARREAWIGNGTRGERRAQLGIDVVHAVLLGDARQIGRPADLAGLLEQRELSRRVFQERPQGAVIHDEIQARPVLRGFGQVVHGSVLPYTGPRGLIIQRQQTLVDTDVATARLHELLVHGIHQRFVVETPHRFLGGRRQ